MLRTARRTECLPLSPPVLDSRISSGISTTSPAKQASSSISRSIRIDIGVGRLTAALEILGKSGGSTAVFSSSMIAVFSATEVGVKHLASQNQRRQRRQLLPSAWNRANVRHLRVGLQM